MMKVYLSGPMTGLPRHNVPAFFKHGAELSMSGYDVYSPAEASIDLVAQETAHKGVSQAEIPAYLDDPGFYEAAWARIPRETFLRQDAAMIAQVDAIAMLPGWQRSPGANWELQLATSLGIPAFCHHMRALGSGEDDCSASDDFPDHADMSVDERPATEVWEQLERARKPLPLEAFVVEETTGAVKADAGKAPLDLMPAKPLVAIAEILGFGATKYAPHNWRRGFKWSRMTGAALRHLTAWADGEDLDPETGKSHLAHAGADILFLLEYELTGTGIDDRYKKETNDAAPS
jgi:hypothetical protein